MKEECQENEIPVKLIFNEVVVCRAGSELLIITDAARD